MPIRPRRATGVELIEDDDGYIVHDPAHDRVHQLNPTASLVLELCTGELAVDEIARLVQETFALETPPLAAVTRVVEDFRAAGLVITDAPPA